MKKSFLMIISLLLVCATVFALEKVGVVKLVVGNANYKASNSAKLNPLNINDEIHMEGTIQTELGSKVKIQWLDKTLFTVDADQSVQVAAIYEKTHQSSSSSKKLLGKLKQLTAQNSSSPTSVAGIRRSEVEGSNESELYWAVDPQIPISKPIELFQQQLYDEAIELFQKIVEQAPLSKDAETARGFLIICFERKGDEKNKNLQLELLRKDFKDSALLESYDTKE